MTEPPDPMPAAAGHGHLRVSHLEREQVIDVLKAAFVQGMLAKDEFDLRVGQAFASRTYAELAAVTADLPAMPVAAQPPKPARAEGERPVLRPAPVIKVATVLYAVAWSFALLLPWPKDGDGDRMGAVLLVFFSTLIYLYVSAVAGAHLLDSRREKRSGRQRPPRPGRDGRGLECEWPGSIGHDPALPGADPDQTRTDMRIYDSRRSRPHSSRPSAWVSRGIRPAPGAV